MTTKTKKVTVMEKLKNKLDKVVLSHMESSKESDVMEHQDDETTGLAEHSDSGSAAVCPECGLQYQDSSDTWICCDTCGSWFDIQCAFPNGSEVPEEYYCKNCTC